MQNIRVKGTIGRGRGRGRGNRLKHIDEVLDRSTEIDGEYYDTVKHLEIFINSILLRYGYSLGESVDVTISLEE